MITFSWDISDIDVTNNESQNNVVRSFTWTLTAELEGNTSEHSGVYTTSEGLEGTTVESFTEFSDLTLAQCASWVETSLGLELERIKEKLTLQVKAKVKEASKNIVSAPW